MSFLWNFFQQGQIVKGQATADQASTKSLSNTKTISALEERIDTLSLASHAMWEILSRSLGYTEKDLLLKMEEIDLRDGIKDGKLAAKNSTECIPKKFGRSFRKRW